MKIYNLSKHLIGGIIKINDNPFLLLAQSNADNKSYIIMDIMTAKISNFQDIYGINLWLILEYFYDKILETFSLNINKYLLELKENKKFLSKYIQKDTEINFLPFGPLSIDIFLHKIESTENFDPKNDYKDMCLKNQRKIFAKHHFDLLIKNFKVNDWFVIQSETYKLTSIIDNTYYFTPINQELDKKKFDLENMNLDHFQKIPEYTSDWTTVHVKHPEIEIPEFIKNIILMYAKKFPIEVFWMPDNKEIIKVPNIKYLTDQLNQMLDNN